MIIHLADGYSFNPKGRCDCGRGPTITDYNGQETCRRCSTGFCDDEIAWKRVDAGEALPQYNSGLERLGFEARAKAVHRG